jgi:hypothetical protein
VVVVLPNVLYNSHDETRERLVHGMSRPCLAPGYAKVWFILLSKNKEDTCDTRLSVH